MNKIYFILLSGLLLTNNLSASFIDDILKRFVKKEENDLEKSVEEDDKEITNEETAEEEKKELEKKDVVEAETPAKKEDLKKDEEPKQENPSISDSSRAGGETLKENLQPKKVPCFDASLGFANVVEKVLPAVVNVATTQMIGDKDDQDMSITPGLQGSPFEDLFKRFVEQQNRPKKVQSLGSGFIVHVDSKEFYVVTNYHVVADAKQIKIFMNDKTEVEARLHASDERTDIAVIKVSIDCLPEDKRKVTALKWGDTESSRVGDWVIAIGNPFGFGSSVTVGVLSHKGRDTVSRAMGGRLSDYVDDYIQHSAQINFGNSGGGLLDTSGHVIGINTAIISPSGGNVGIGFAIPSHIAKKTVDQLIACGRTKRGWLGVKIQPFTEEMAESLGKKKLANKPIIVSVTDGGPAQKAMLQDKDIIIEFNGKALDGQTKLSRLVGETEVGSTVPIKVWRKTGNEVTVNVTVGEYEDAEQKGQLNDDKDNKMQTQDSDKVLDVLGISVATLTNQLKDRLHVHDKNIKGGVVVLKVDPSKAGDIGLMRGDIIIEVNHEPIATPQEFSQKIEKAKGKHKNMLLLITRNDGDPHYITIKLADDEAEEVDKTEKTNKVESKNQKQAITEHPGNKPKVAM